MSRLNESDCLLVALAVTDALGLVDSRNSCGGGAHTLRDGFCFEQQPPQQPPHTTTGLTSLPVMMWLLMMLLMRAGCNSRLSSVNPGTDLMALSIASSVGASRTKDWLPSVSVEVGWCVGWNGWDGGMEAYTAYIPPNPATSMSKESMVKLPSRSVAVPSVRSLHISVFGLAVLCAPVCGVAMHRNLNEAALCELCVG